MDLIAKIPKHGRFNKYLFLFTFLLFSIIVYGQQVPEVTIIQPVNNAVFDGKQIRVNFEVSGAAPNITRIYVDDRQVQLMTTEIKIGQNTAIVDVPGRDCKISIVAENNSGKSRAAVVNLKWNEQIFKPTLYILAIGVSKYNSSDLQLQFAAKDASDFSQSMLRQEGLVYEKVKIKQLLDEKANAENIRDGLYWLQTETTYKDVAMIYMAGHGINNNVGEFFFMPVNADMNRVNATCVRYAEIKATVDNISGKLFMFVDACHSGNVLGNNQRRAAQISQAISEMTSADNETIVFTSSSGQQFSLENAEWNNGAFTKALVEGLDGKADLARNGTITVLNLASYVADRVKELTNGQQTPVTKGNITNFPLALVKMTNAEITLVSPQEGATIMVNSERKGISKWTGILPEGNHVVEVQKELYRTEKQTITVTGGKNQTINLPEMVAKHGTLAIHATNTVAEIFIDGVKQNTKTPAYLDHVLVGEHTVKLTAGGYDDVTKTVIIEDGKTADITVALIAEAIIPPPVAPKNMDETQKEHEVKATAAPAVISLFANGRKVYQTDKKLTATEVRELMFHTNALRTYNKSVSKNITANGCLITGACIVAGGVYTAAGKPFEERYDYQGSDGNLYVDYHDGKNVKIGSVMAAAGVVMAITGVTLKISSKNLVQKSVNMHNGLKTTNTELKLDITGNGLRLAVRF